MRAALSTLRLRGTGQLTVWAAIAASFGTVVSLVVGSALYLGAVGPASVDRQVAARCGPTAGMTVIATDLPPTAETIDVRQRAVDAVARDQLVGRERLVVVDAGEAQSGPGGDGRAEPVVLASKTGAGAHVDVLADAGGDGALVPRSAADRLGLAPGDALSIAVASPQGPRRASVRVRGVYADLRQPLDPFWCQQRLLLVPPDDFSQRTPPAFLLVDEPALLAFAAANGLHLRATFEARPPAPSPSLAEMRGAAHEVAAFQQQAPRAGPFAVDRFGHAVEVLTDLRFLVSRATAVRDDVRRVVLPIGFATVAAAVAMIVLVGVLWVDRHEREVALLDALGSSRAAVVVRAVAEVTVPALAGAALGAFATVPVVSAIGPRPVGFGALAGAARLAAPVVLAGLATFAAGVAFRRQAVSASRRRRRAWLSVAAAELVAVGVAAVCALALGDDEGGDAIEPRTVLAAVAFVVAATAAALGPLLAGGRWLAGRLRPRRPIVLLVTSRVRADLLPTAAVVGVASACVGLFAFGTILEGSARRTVDAKAGVFVGAPVSLVAPDLEDVPRALSGRATSVRWFADVATGAGDVDVLGIDPATFTDAAFWDDSLASTSLDAAVARLRGRRAAGEPVPAIVVGRVPTRTRLESLDVDVRAIASAKAFPGLRARPLVVVPDAALQSDGGERRLWADAPLAEVAGALRNAGVEARRPITTDAVFDAPAFYTLQWSFGFVRGTAVWAAAVATIGFLVHLDLRRRRAAAAEVVLSTMGMGRPRQAMARAVELSIALVAGCGLGTALAYASASGSHRTVDLTPYVPPAAILSVPAARLAVVCVAVIAAVPLLAAAVYLRSPGARAKVLRSELV